MRADGRTDGRTEAWAKNAAAAKHQSAGVSLQTMQLSDLFVVAGGFCFFLPCFFLSVFSRTVAARVERGEEK